MNHILELFDRDYTLALLKRKVLPEYPGYRTIKDLEIIPYKKHIWEKTYHVVVEIKTTFIRQDGDEEVLPIFCSAHNQEPRENVYRALRFLWEHGFHSDHLTIPRPLFFSPYLNGVFYRGVSGYNLQYYMWRKDFTTVERIIPQAAKWFAKLHALKDLSDYNFNHESGHIRTVVPGAAKVFGIIERKYPGHLSFYRGAYEIFMAEEEEFLDSTEKRWLIHGDAHPENIIKINDIQIAAIDFSDMSLSDFARDLGCWLQQFEFMAQKEEFSAEQIAKYKELFLDNYFANSREELTPDLQRRIDNYYNWTKLRTITYLLISGVIKRDEERMAQINDMINELKNNLGI
jgi:thiamine kinase-like enzyme